MKTLKLLLIFGLIIAMFSLVVGAADSDYVPSPGNSQNAEDTDWTPDDVETPSTDVQSPQTGVSETGVAAAAVSAVIFTAGTVVLGKKLKKTVA